MPNAFTLLIAGCVAAVSIPSAAAPTAKLVARAKTEPPPKGPAELAEMLARFDKLSAGKERDALALEIDRFAGQRYATVSRLYWFQDLDAAKAAAAAQKRPILHLRMLGRLDEDLSCANSRFFRSTLYANEETSKFLRDNFVLYWSSERPVPRVTIDFGDGRKIERTTTGNSAHYVMDERGNVLDVLPGLYAPIVFRQELAKSATFAKNVRALDGHKLLHEVMKFHQEGQRATNERYSKLAGVDFVVRRGRLVRPGEVGPKAIEVAQQATYAKMAVEVPDLRKIGIDAGTIDPSDLAQWATIGQKTWNIFPNNPNEPSLFDKQSLALIAKLRTGNPKAADSARAVSRLEQAVLADTSLNQFRLRQMIRTRLVARGTLDFSSLNDWVYANVFATPKGDEWLGLLDASDFTGLPADGVVH